MYSRNILMWLVVDNEWHLVMPIHSYAIIYINLPHWLPQDLAVLVLLHWPRLLLACARDLAVLVLHREPPLSYWWKLLSAYLMIVV
jgi:hypothetical protein